MGLGSSTSHIQHPHTQGSGVLHIPYPIPTYRGVWVLLTSIQHPHTRGSDAHLPGDPGSRSPHLGTHITAALVPTHPGLWGPARLPPAPTPPQMRHPRTQGPRSPPHTALTGRQLRLGDPRRSCPSLLALSSPRSAPSGTTKHPQQASKREGKEENKPDPPPKKGGRGAPRHRGGGSGPLPPTSIRPIVLLWGSPESSAGLG